MDFLPVTLIATVMGVVVFAAGQVFEMPMSLLLLTQIAIGAFLYGGLCFLFKVNAYSVVLAAILKRRSGMLLNLVVWLFGLVFMKPGGTKDVGLECLS